MKSFSPVRYLKSLRALLFLASLLGIWGLRVPLWNSLSTLGNPRAIVDYLQGLHTLGPVILFLLLLGQVFIAFIPGHAIVVAAGYLYGAPTTIMVVAASTIMGSQIAFCLARRYGRPLIHKLASPKTVDHWDRLAGNCGPLFFFFTFVLPVFPSDLMCYVAGLGKVSPKAFFAANFSGRLLSTIVMTLIGAYGFHPPLWFWILFLASLIVILTGWTIYKRIHHIHLRGRDRDPRSLKTLKGDSYESLP